MTGRRLAGFLIGLLISGAAAVWLALTVDLSQVGAAFARANPSWLLPAFAVLAVQAVVRAIRWSGLVRSTTGQSVPPSRTLDPMLSGYLINALLPGRVGELARTMVLAQRESLPVGRVAASVVVERAVDILALLLLAAAAMLAAGAAITLTIVAIAVGVLALLLVARYARVAVRRIPAWVPRAVARPLALSAVVNVRVPLGAIDGWTENRALLSLVTMKSRA